MVLVFVNKLSRLPSSSVCKHFESIASFSLLEEKEIKRMLTSVNTKLARVEVSLWEKPVE
jgi:hypothetical protein